MINFGLIWKYFYTIVDCGLISKESRDSLTKVPQRNGIFGFRSLDRDRAVQIDPVAVLILGVYL